MERDSVTARVAENIQAQIKRQGTNPAEVARRAGINPTGVYDILSGKSRNPRLDTLNKIALQGLSVPLGALFAQPDEDPLEQELIGAFAQMAPADRKRFLEIARAWRSGPENT